MGTKPENCFLNDKVDENEIDMDLLGCNARIVWNDIYHHILDILSTRSNPCGIIICKNFHNIHSELLDVFYKHEAQRLSLGVFFSSLFV